MLLPSLHRLFTASSSVEYTNTLSFWVLSKPASDFFCEAAQTWIYNTQLFNKEAKMDKDSLVMQKKLN